MFFLTIHSTLCNLLLKSIAFYVFLPGGYHVTLRPADAHATAATLGLVFIATFFISTVIAEIGGDRAMIVRVKTGIFYTVFALVPIMATAGLLGRRLAGTSQEPIIKRKMRRMQLVTMNAVVVLIPCVVVLYWLASHGRFGWQFFAVQAVELLAGAVNVVLPGLNLRDGLRLRAGRTDHPAAANNKEYPLAQAT